MIIDSSSGGDSYRRKKFIITFIKWHHIPDTSTHIIKLRQRKGVGQWERWMWRISLFVNYLYTVIITNKLNEWVNTKTHNYTPLVKPIEKALLFSQYLVIYTWYLQKNCEYRDCIQIHGSYLYQYISMMICIYTIIIVI